MIKSHLRRLGLIIIGLVVGLTELTAQELPPLRIRRGERQMVKGGVMQQPDTLKRSEADSLLTTEVIDSLRHLATDSLMLDSLLHRARLEAVAVVGRELDTMRMERADSLLSQLPDSLLAEATDSLLGSRLLDSLRRGDSLLAEKSDSTTRRRKGWLMSDSMSLSKVCWAATVLPGYGQIYNKQYWKLPILYGTVAAGISMFVYENNRYQPLKRHFDEITSISRTRTEYLDNLQADMIRHNTNRQLYLIASIASYVYFIGDAAINYSTNEVSDVKKATTLACICPGAGQIYNRSYWKIPFVVGGFSALIYCVDWNNRGYQRFKKAYTLRANYDKVLEAYNQNPVGDTPVSTDEFGGRYSASFLKNLRDNYRRNRDLCIILTAGLYVLQIIDAHVDAHLKDYDISDDLSMHIEPMIDYSYVPSAGGNRASFGFNLNINF